MSAPLIAIPSILAANRHREEQDAAEAHLREYDPIAAGFDDFRGEPRDERLQVVLAMFPNHVIAGSTPEDLAALEAAYLRKIAAAAVHTATSTGVTELPVSLLHRAAAHHLRYEGNQRLAGQYETLYEDLIAYRDGLGFGGRRAFGKFVAQHNFWVVADTLKTPSWYYYDGLEGVNHQLGTCLPGPDVMFEGFDQTIEGVSLVDAVAYGMRHVPDRLQVETERVQSVVGAITGQFPDFAQPAPQS